MLAASYSGTTEELRRLTETLRRLAVPLVMMTGNAEEPASRSSPTFTSQSRSIKRPAR